MEGDKPNKVTMRLSRSSIPSLTSTIVVTVAGLRVAGSISTAAILGAGVFSETAVVAAGGMAGESRVDDEGKNGDEDEWRRWSCRLWRFFRWGEEETLKGRHALRYR